MIEGLIAGLVAMFIVHFIVHRITVRRLRYERDCYRTALDVLEANGFFTHKAKELVRQHLPQ